MDILRIISPIELLRGSHDDTGETGKGCFMNVVAYLNGEPQITDRSTCVCDTIRPVAIFLNDFMDDADRGRLLPFIPRALGSRTSDIEVIAARRAVGLRFAQAISTAAKSLIKSGVLQRAIDRALALDLSLDRALALALSLDRALEIRVERQRFYAAVIDAGMIFMDQACPKMDPENAISGEVGFRAEKLAALATG